MSGSSRTKKVRSIRKEFGGIVELIQGIFQVIKNHVFVQIVTNVVSEQRILDCSR